MPGHDATPPGHGGSRPVWLVGLTEYAGVTAYTGGIGRHYASLLPALVRAGIDIDLVLFTESESLAAEPGAGVRLIGHRSAGRTPRWLRPLSRALTFRRIARRHRYDRILVPEWSGLAAALPRRAPLVTNLATGMRLANVVSGVQTRSLPRRRRLEIAVQSRCEERQIRHSRGIVPISHAMRNATGDLIGRLPPSVVVRNCIDATDVRRRSTETTPPVGWPDGDAPVVLFLGRLERRKGVVDAAMAFATVAESHPRVRFVFAGASGDGRFEPTLQQVRELCRPRDGSRVSFLGHVPGDELYAAIGAADVVVCPSRWEGFGQAALEVKAIGRPLVVTTGSGYDDFCADGVDCAMVPPAHPEALAGAICGLLDDPARAARLADRARRDIDRFTADAVAPDMIEAVTHLGAAVLMSARHSTRTRHA